MGMFIQFFNIYIVFKTPNTKYYSKKQLLLHKNKIQHTSRKFPKPSHRNITRELVLRFFFFYPPQADFNLTLACICPPTWWFQESPALAAHPWGWRPVVSTPSERVFFLRTHLLNQCPCSEHGRSCNTQDI